MEKKQVGRKQARRKGGKVRRKEGGKEERKERMKQASKKASKYERKIREEKITFWREIRRYEARNIDGEWDKVTAKQRKRKDRFIILPFQMAFPRT